MDIALLSSVAMSIISPLLMKASEKAAETIGEKFVNNALEKNVWHKVKELFIKDSLNDDFQKIENKNIATPEDINVIEQNLMMQ